MMDRYYVETNDLYDLEKSDDGSLVLYADALEAARVAIVAAVAAERERCAKLCDAIASDALYLTKDESERLAAQACSYAIRNGVA